MKALAGKRFEAALLVAVRQKPVNSGFGEVLLDSFASVGFGKFIVTDRANRVKLYGLIDTVESSGISGVEHKNIPEILTALGKDKVDPNSIVGGGLLTIDREISLIHAHSSSARYGPVQRSLLEHALVFPEWEGIIEIN